MSINLINSIILIWCGVHMLHEVRALLQKPDELNERKQKMPPFSKMALEKT